MFRNNVVMLSGRSCDTPKLRTTTNSQVATIRLAVNERKKQGDKWVDDPIYIDCECWGKQAEYAVKNVTKGTPVSVVGKLRMDSWEKDGVKNQRMKIDVRFDLQVDNPRENTESGDESNTPVAALPKSNLPF